MSKQIIQTRERLVESARKLFLKYGYGATGIAHILEDAKAKSGSLYYFFPAKEDLLLTVLELYKEKLWPWVIQPVFDRISDPIERIFAVLDGYRQMLLMTACSQGCPIGNLALELSESHPKVRQGVAENFTGWRKAIQQCLDDAKERMPKQLDTEQLSLFVLNTMEGAVMLARAYRTIDVYDSAVRHLRDYFDRLLADGRSTVHEDHSAS